MMALISSMKEKWKECMKKIIDTQKDKTSIWIIQDPSIQEDKEDLLTDLSGIRSRLLK
jgi:hypothetical protein